MIDLIIEAERVELLAGEPAPVDMSADDGGSQRSGDDIDALPIVLVHGGGQGTEFQITPDGRPGWARLLASDGFDVYVVDVLGTVTHPTTPQSWDPSHQPEVPRFCVILDMDEVLAQPTWPQLVW